MAVIVFIHERIERKEKMSASTKQATMQRLKNLLELQKSLEAKFGSDNYNVFVFGSYITTAYVEGESDIDIAIYSRDFEVYKRIAMYIESFFDEQHVPSDIFYIDVCNPAAVFCAPLSSPVQLTDYFPDELDSFKCECKKILDLNKVRMAV